MCPCRSSLAEPLPHPLTHSPLPPHRGGLVSLALSPSPWEIDTPQIRARRISDPFWVYDPFLVFLGILRVFLTFLVFLVKIW
jgi:hypothetical protein